MARGRSDQPMTHVVDTRRALCQSLGDADEAGERVDVEELVGRGQPIDLKGQLVLRVLWKNTDTHSAMP